MKATGIVRRMDDLGRVVIPKEIRRILRIRENDPFEMFTTDDGIFLKKQKVAGRITDSKILLGAIQQIVMAPILLCNMDSVIDSVWIVESKYRGRALTDEITQIIEERNFYVHGDGMPDVPVFEGSKLIAEMIMPIIPKGYLFGALIIPQSGEPLHWDNASLSLKMAAKYLELYLEETL
ncbi:MAG: AbrB/MazE/SpoVT family DNA-binding domain-containing protein [Clostridia bacterium]|nr:AbrB/MazE/SpoVT family DNA-binding domain-containing protein [Clostridia bacterium]